MRTIFLILIIILIYACNTQEDVVLENVTIEHQEENTVLESQETELADENTSQEEQISEEFVITEEIYKETFSNINSIITELNNIIQRKDYDAWLTYLTENYIIETTRPSYLEKWENDINLQEKNIVIQSLRDYFDYLVVPRRSNVQLDEIEFIDKDRVYAYTVINGVQYLLYNLLRIENNWKIDFY